MKHVYSFGIPAPIAHICSHVAVMQLMCNMHKSRSVSRRFWLSENKQFYKFHGPPSATLSRGLGDRPKAWQQSRQTNQPRCEKNCSSVRGPSRYSLNASRFEMPNMFVNVLCFNDQRPWTGVKNGDSKGQILILVQALQCVRFCRTCPPRSTKRWPDPLWTVNLLNRHAFPHPLCSVCMVET